MFPQACSIELNCWDALKKTFRGQIGFCTICCHPSPPTTGLQDTPSLCVTVGSAAVKTHLTQCFLNTLALEPFYYMGVVNILQKHSGRYTALMLTIEPESNGRINFRIIPVTVLLYYVAKLWISLNKSVFNVCRPQFLNYKLLKLLKNDQL